MLVFLILVLILVVGVNAEELPESDITKCKEVKCAEKNPRESHFQIETDCGNQEGCDEFANCWKNECNPDCSKCKNPVCFSQTACYVSAGKGYGYGFGSEEVAREEATDQCIKACTNAWEQECNTIGIQARKSLESELKGGEGCDKVPLAESADCGKVTLPKLDEVNNLGQGIKEDAFAKIKEFMDMAKGLIGEKKDDKNKEQPQQPSPVCADGVQPGANSVCLSEVVCQDGFELRPFQGRDVCQKKDASDNKITAAIGALDLSIERKQATFSGSGLSCWSADHVHMMGDDEIKRIDNPKTLKMLAEQYPDDIPKFGPDQMAIGGQAFGNYFLTPVGKQRLAGRSDLANAYLDGAIAGGHQLLVEEFPEGIQTSTFANHNFEGAPGQPASGGGVDPRGGGDGMQMVQQFVGMVKDLFAEKGSGATNQLPGQIQAPSSLSPDVDKPSSGVTVMDSTFCINGKARFTQGKLVCYTAAGAQIFASSGQPLITVNGVITGNPDLVVRNPESNDNTVAGRFASSAVGNPKQAGSGFDATLAPGSILSFSGGNDKIPFGNRGTMAAVFSPDRRLRVDVSDHVVIKDYETLSISRSPYDSIADERPIFHIMTNQLLNLGEDYPKYRVRPSKQDREYSTRLSFFKGFNPSPASDEITFGKLAKDYVQVIPNKDARIDLWAQHSFLSAVSQNKVVRGLSTMVDPRNLGIETIMDYFVDGDGGYDYFVGGGVVVGRNKLNRRRIIESSFPPSPMLSVQRRLVYG